MISKVCHSQRTAEGGCALAVCTAGVCYFADESENHFSTFSSSQPIRLPLTVSKFTPTM